MTEPKSDEFDFAKVAESGSIVIQHLGFGVSGDSRVIADHINAAHDSIVKPLREKAGMYNVLKAKLEVYRGLGVAMEKDRDAWKEKAGKLEREVKLLTEEVIGLAEADEDADRLAEVLKDGIEKVTSEYCSHDSSHGPKERRCYAGKMIEALAAHEKLKGGA